MKAEDPKAEDAKPPSKDAKPSAVKVEVDYDVCVSSGTCVHECPEVFEIRADGFLYLLMEDIPQELEEKAKLAEELCPTGAITLVGADGKPLR